MKGSLSTIYLNKELIGANEDHTVAEQDPVEATGVVTEVDIEVV